MILPYTPAQTQALRALAVRLQRMYPARADQERIAKALQLVLDGRVTLPTDPADHYATVQSSDGVHTYRVNGICQCHDFLRHAATACKHRFAVALARRYHKTRRAIHLGTSQATWQEGLAWDVTPEAVGFLADGADMVYTYPRAEVMLLGLVALQTEENLAELACNR